MVDPMSLHSPLSHIVILVVLLPCMAAKLLSHMALHVNCCCYAA